LLTVAALVFLDVYIQITRLNKRVFSVDIRLNKIINDCQDLFKVSSKPKFVVPPLHKRNSAKSKYDETHTNKKEFAYYRQCFTDTWRENEWKQVPSNTLVKGDIIRLLTGDMAPTLIERIIFNQT
jgi:hypothetical protein